MRGLLGRGGGGRRRASRRGGFEGEHSWKAPSTGGGGGAVGHPYRRRRRDTTCPWVATHVIMSLTRPVKPACSLASRPAHAEEGLGSMGRPWEVGLRLSLVSDVGTSLPHLRSRRSRALCVSYGRCPKACVPRVFDGRAVIALASSWMRGWARMPCSHNGTAPPWPRSALYPPGAQRYETLIHTRRGAVLSNNS